MNTCLLGCVLATAGGFLMGCSDTPPKPVKKIEQAATKPDPLHAAVPADTATATSARSDHERLEGSWHFVTLSTGLGKDDHIVFTDDKISWHVGKQSLEGTFVIDAAKQPKPIDIMLPGQKELPGRLVGIYEFKNDLLAICIGPPGGPRPGKLEAGEKQTLLLFYPSAREDKPSIGTR